MTKIRDCQFVASRNIEPEFPGRKIGAGLAPGIKRAPYISILHLSRNFAGRDSNHKVARLLTVPDVWNFPAFRNLTIPHLTAGE